MPVLIMAGACERDKARGGKQAPFLSELRDSPGSTRHAYSNAEGEEVQHNANSRAQIGVREDLNRNDTTEMSLTITKHRNAHKFRNARDESCDE